MPIVGHLPRKSSIPLFTLSWRFFHNCGCSFLQLPLFLEREAVPIRIKYKLVGDFGSVSHSDQPARVSQANQDHFHPPCNPERVSLCFFTSPHPFYKLSVGGVWI